MALYLGDGDLEKRLLETLDRQLEKEKELRLEFWFDGLRGMRRSSSLNGVSTFDLIQPLAIKYPSRCSIFMYTSKQMQGVRGKIVPSRFKEVFGVSHIKLYIFDNDILLSG